MSPKDMETVLKHYMSKLSPADLEELDGQLDGGAEPEPMAADHRLPADMQGRWLAMDAKSRNAVRASWRDRAEARSKASKDFAERFPNANRLR